MKKAICISLFMCMFFTSVVVSSYSDVAVEPFTYQQDFETGEPSAWASYPFWQDTAWDPNFRAGIMVPGDPNISIIQKVTPYTNVDNYTGAQKKLDMYLVPGSSIRLRYYIKTMCPTEFFKVRLAGGDDGEIDFTVKYPPVNRWEWLTVTYTDFIKENPCLSGRDQVKVNALAVLTKVPDADPDIPFYFGLDDVVFKGARAVQFQFFEPVVYKLSEWKPYIPRMHYKRGDTFKLRGNWPVNADRISLDLVLSTDDKGKKYLSTTLNKRGDEWSLKPFKLTYPEGLYLGIMTAYRGTEKLTDIVEFMLYIAPKDIGGRHPRLWFDAEKKKWVEDRLKSDRFKSVADDILSRAKKQRDEWPVEKVFYDMDQFPGGDIDPNWGLTISPWFERIRGVWEDGIYYNALAYSLLGDREAGDYTKGLLLKLSTFPSWLHPWWIDRGRHIYYPVGELGMTVALGYDLVYDLMNEQERAAVRKAMMKNIVLGCHKGYVEDDLVTNNTSNWVAHITGGSLMCQAAMYGDGPDVEELEPYFCGVIFKDYWLIQKVLDRDGAYGEGYGYYRFSMLSWSKSLPAFNNVFKIDLSGKLNGSYKELIWAGPIKEKEYFYFGDTGGNLGSLTNWAWLLDRYQDPLLGWLYNFLKGGETFMDVLYETEAVPRDDPFDEQPVKLFRDVGTTVFKSGWEPDDFIFVMRTGAFYNHQHLDQGSFWLADRGSVFIEERHGSTYYLDPLYQPWYTQPVGHSTILIDRNHQSQRVGDPLRFAKGFHEHAFVYHFLDGKDAAFSSGDIGRLYWGKVKCLRRNVLYLKPRTLLMLDTVVPGEHDVGVTLLYQTLHLQDIKADKEQSTINKDGTTLFITHMYPEYREVESVETPHYLYTLQRQKPLVKEGMLTVTARTAGVPLVMANLIATSTRGKPEIDTEKGNGYISGTANGVSFAFTTKPGSLYNVGTITTDALALTRGEDRIFAALCTSVMADGNLIIESEKPITCESQAGNITYYLAEDSKVAIGGIIKPSVITLNGKKLQVLHHDAERNAAVIILPAGEGTVVF